MYWWRRKGYTFDISMHTLFGSRGGPAQQMWRELGVLQDQAFVYHDEAVRVESRGKTLSICTSPRRLEEQMLKLSPHDSRITRKLVRLLTGRDITGAYSLKPEETIGFLDNLKMLATILPMLGIFRKYGKTTIQEFAGQFRDPFLRDAVRFVVESGWPMPGLPMIALAGYLNWAVREMAAFHWVGLTESSSA